MLLVNFLATSCEHEKRMESKQDKRKVNTTKGDVINSIYIGTARAVIVVKIWDDLAENI